MGSKNSRENHGDHSTSDQYHLHLPLSEESTQHLTMVSVLMPLFLNSFLIYLLLLVLELDSLYKDYCGTTMHFLYLLCKAGLLQWTFAVIYDMTMKAVEAIELN